VHRVSFHFSLFKRAILPSSLLGVYCEPVVYRRSVGPAECRGRLQ
jgi:hypothetical protein